MRKSGVLPKNIEIIQTLRGLAAMGVVFRHFWYGQKDIVIVPFLNRLSRIGAYGVQVFFIISGFILLYSLNKYNYQIRSFFRFILKRFIRLEPAYIVSLILVLFFAWVLGPFLNVPFEAIHNKPRDLYLHLLYLIPFVKGSWWAQGVYWTLAIEFQFYLVIGLCAAFFIKANANKYYKHLLLVILLATGLCFRNLNFFMAWMSFFAAGMASFLFITKMFNWKDFVFQWVLCLAVNWIILANLKYIGILIFVPPLIIFLLEYKGAPFQFLGKISYSLYLVHGSVGLFVLQYLRQQIDLSQILNQIIVLLTSIAVSILSACLVFHLFEKPFSKRSKSISL